MAGPLGGYVDSNYPGSPQRIISPAGGYNFKRAGSGGATSNGLLTGLLSYWTLNESSGNRADSKGSATMVQTGSVTGAAGFGNVGAVSVWSGSNSNYLSVGAAAVTSGSWTFAGWFNLANVTGNKFLFSNGASGGANTLFLRTSNASLLGTVSGGGGLGAATLSATTWYFVAFTYAPTTVAWYLNASSTPDRTATETASYAGANITTLGISQAILASLNGSLVGWGVWSRVLSNADQVFLYNGGSGRAYSEFN